MSRDEEETQSTRETGRAAGEETISGEERRLGPFRLLGLIGKGGQGEVHVAVDERLGRRVALKLLSRHLDILAPETGSRLRARFEREAELAARLDHPGICSIHEYGETEGLPWIAMQLVEGESLRAVIEAERRRRDPEALQSEPDFEAPTVVLGGNGRAEEGESGSATSETRTARPFIRSERGHIARIVAIVESAARALHVAHEAGLVHRDVKPGNLMVTARDEAVVLDFGLAADERAEGPALTDPGDFVGTPAYVAPEQLGDGRTPVDRRTDVHALGVVLFEGLTLRRPYEAASRDALYRMIADEEPPPIRRLEPAVSRDLAVVVATALAKDPDRRYDSALALAEDLRRVRQRLPILARPLGPGARLWRWTVRNPAIATLLGLIGLLVVFGVTWTAMKNRELSRSLGEYERLADLRRLVEARDEAEAQWPVHPDRIPELERWLDRHAGLAARLPAHRAALSALDAAGEADADLRFRRENLRRLCAELEDFSAPEDGLLVAVRRRLADARRIRDATIEDAARAWAEAARRIAASPRYAGLSLPPQLGLVPLGPDPASGLEEFLHWPSHDRAAREDLVHLRDDGRSLVAAPEQGLVLVLVPGGVFTMGAQARDPSAPGYDSRAEPGEAPLTEIALAPFFLSKFETTQAQWRRMANATPSAYGVGFIEVPAMREAVSEIHPVENVSWHEADAIARRQALVLPTEARWEYAARLGGMKADGDPVAANLAGRETRRHFRIFSDDHEDPHLVHAPVGRFPADALGLHDLAGNVREWCRDRHAAYTTPPRAGDGLRDEPTRERMIRGAAFNAPRAEARPALRHAIDPGIRDDFLGVRFARDLDPRR